MRENLAGKTVEKATPPSSLHKFCWFNGEAEQYDGMLAGRTVWTAEGFGIFAELAFDGGKRLCINDGVNARLVRPGEKLLEKYQLRIHFTDGSLLAFSVAMYGGIICHEGGWDTEKNLLGLPGGYRTRMSKNMLGTPCARCQTEIVKMTYLGGAVYFCPECQAVKETAV